MSADAGGSRFGAIVAWELRYYLRRASTWIYFGIFFALGFLMMNLAGGAWSDANLIIGSGSKVHANSPWAITVMTITLALLGTSITAALAGNAVYRDYETGIHPLFFTTPVSRAAFLGGRFASSMLVNFMVVAGIGIGVALASVMPWLDQSRIGPFHGTAYVAAYAMFIIPNVLFAGAIFFSLASVTRQMLPNYVGAVLLLVGYLLAASLIRDIENKKTGALLDPFGVQAFGLATRYWSIAEKNGSLVPFSGVLLANRLLWAGLGLAIFAVAFSRFQFAHVAGERKRRGKGRAAAVLEAAATPSRAAPLQLRAVPRSFGGAARLAQFASIARRSFWEIVHNRYFYAIVGGGLLFLIFSAREAGKLYGTNTYPVTYEVEELMSGTFGLFVLVIVTFYSGELVWAERDLKVNQIHDATPVPTAVRVLAKLTALAGVIAVLVLVTMICGVLTQAAKGYYHFELGLYVRALFGIRYIDYLLLAVLALTIHVLVNNKYVAHLLVLLFYVGNGLLGQLGLQHNLYAYASDSGSTYSDMNGFGPFAGPFIIWKLYWSAFAALLAIVSILFWVRGQETAPGWRTRIARTRLTRPVRIAAAVASVAFVGLGGFIFYNTNVLNEYRTDKQDRKSAAEYERLYKRYETAPQPRVTGVTVRVDIDPKRGSVLARGTIALRNKTTQPIDTVHLQWSREADVRALDFDRPSARVLDDREHEYHMYRLTTPLQPGDSLALRFTIAYVPHGFENKVRATEVVENGSFFHGGEVLPSIGYDPARELSQDDVRKKQGLKPKPRMHPPTDLAARANNYVSHQADWIDFDATVSTDPDQIAIAPGYLQREWMENGRRVFHYRMDVPILDLVAFQSARYAIRRDRWHGPAGKDVAIEIYYHRGHEYNLDRMIKGVQRSLDYYTTHFGPYQHRQLRIVEFPRYASFAQSLPNTIPYSEAIGFIARVDENNIDYPFYVTAHEVAHQWWAHQVIGADAQGSTMLSETLAQYSALMVMEQEYGRAKMKRFLTYELDSYLIGRSAERRKELPLELVENQPYIHYRKGSLAMYALRDYIGEERVNAALAGFLRATKFQQPPYTTSLELVDSLRAETPDSLRYLIADLFENITLYELRADSASSSPLPGGRWQVDLAVTAKKLRADSLGNETERPMREWVDIGVFADGASSGDKDGVPISLEKRLIVTGPQHLRVIVDRKPSRAGIDPSHKLIDRQVNDNVVRIGR